jgi:ferrous iron transport protein A
VPLRLHAIEPGTEVVVAGVEGDDSLAHRLRAAGLWDGARVMLAGRAPFGDPLLFRLHGYRLALRCGEAQRVTVVRAPGRGAESRG